MNDGFIKVAAGTPEIRVADCDYNARSIIELVREAAKLQTRLLVLPELCLTGYTCGDLFLQQTLISGAKKALDTVREQTCGLDMLVLAGLPVQKSGKLYNCAAVLYNGVLLGLIPKTSLPNYGEYAEARYFVPAPSGCEYLTGMSGEPVAFGTDILFTCEELPDFTFAVEVCEDVWSISPPSARHAAAGATVIANITASSEATGKKITRRRLLRSHSERLCCGYVYANAGEGESTSDVVFGGHCMIAENGDLLGESRTFESGITVSELDISMLLFRRRRMTSFPAADDEGYMKVFFSMPLRETPLTRTISAQPFLPLDERRHESCCEDALQIQSHGLRRRMEHIHAKTAVIGVSGGLDSTLALLVAVRAIKLMERPTSDIVAVTMPCFGTSKRTRENAGLLCGALGVELREIDISASVERHFSDIGQAMQNHDVTFENAQARERTQILMDIANQTGGLVIGTGDLSELALGWATYNGDHMSMYAVNASVPKTLVRRLVAHEAEGRCTAALRRVLLDVLDTPISPELTPSERGTIEQKTEDIIGPYELHDFFLYYSLAKGFAPKKLMRLAVYAFAGEYSGAVVKKWLEVFYRRFFSQQYKRSCMPDGPRVGELSLSPRGDWRMPSDAAAALWLSETEEL